MLDTAFRPALAPDLLSVNNLKAEGVPGSKIRFVGNIMIDTLEANRVRASQKDLSEIIKTNTLRLLREEEYMLSGKRDPASGKYAVITIHRPSNVDNREKFRNILDLLTEEFPDDLPVIWPVHPRARKNMESFGFFAEVLGNPKMILLEPVGYIEMLRLNMGARIILTDSGGLQEECTYLALPA